MTREMASAVVVGIVASPEESGLEENQLRYVSSVMCGRSGAD